MEFKLRCAEDDSAKAALKAEKKVQEAQSFQNERNSLNGIPWSHSWTSSTTNRSFSRTNLDEKTPEEFGNFNKIIIILYIHHYLTIFSHDSLFVQMKLVHFKVYIKFTIRTNLYDLYDRTGTGTTGTFGIYIYIKDILMVVVSIYSS